MEKEPLKVKITSDGTRRGTTIINLATGKQLQNIVGVSFQLPPHGTADPGMATVTLEVADAEVELIGPVQTDAPIS